MSSKKEARIAALQKKHTALDQEVSELQASPSECSVKITQLKKEKLAKKDEIQTLSKNPPTKLSVVEAPSSEVLVGDQTKQRDAA